MTDAARQLRGRADRIRETPKAGPGHSPTKRQYGAAAGSPITFCVVRIVDTERARIFVQTLEYLDSPPVEHQTRVSGDFVQAYPPPGVQYDMFTPFLRSLLNAVTALPIEQTIVGTNTLIVFPLPDDGTDDSDEMRAVFDMAIAAEVIGSNVYPMVKTTVGGLPMIFPPVWVDPNTTFYDETQEMSEGSGV